jgi:hypothetical protein
MEAENYEVIFLGELLGGGGGGACMEVCLLGFMTLKKTQAFTGI